MFISPEHGYPPYAPRAILDSNDVQKTASFWEVVLCSLDIFLNTGLKLLLLILQAHNGLVADMACDASGGLLATAGADRNILVWDVDGGYCTHSF